MQGAAGRGAYGVRRMEEARCGGGMEGPPERVENARVCGVP